MAQTDHIDEIAFSTAFPTDKVLEIKTDSFELTPAFGGGGGASLTTHAVSHDWGDDVFFEALMANNINNAVIPQGVFSDTIFFFLSSDANDITFDVGNQLTSPTVIVTYYLAIISTE